LILAGIQYNKFCDKQAQVYSLLDLQRSEEALASLDELKNSWFFAKVLSRLKNQRAEFYAMSYLEGQVRFRIGELKEAGQLFSAASLGQYARLNQRARLAEATSLWLSPKLNAKTIVTILELYRKVITENISVTSWSKQQAKDRAFWIMAHQAGQRTVRRLGQAGQAGSEKKKKALAEEFKRLQQQKPLAKGR
jgi:hypothetical protein